MVSDAFITLRCAKKLMNHGYLKEIFIMSNRIFDEIIENDALEQGCLNYVLRHHVCRSITKAF